MKAVCVDVFNKTSNISRLPLLLLFQIGGGNNLVMLSLVSFAGMTLNKCAVLWIGALTGGPVQGESPPMLVKESHI